MRDYREENKRDKELYERFHFRLRKKHGLRFKLKLKEDNVTFTNWIKTIIEKYIGEEDDE